MIEQTVGRRAIRRAWVVGFVNVLAWAGQHQAHAQSADSNAPRPQSADSNAPRPQSAPSPPAGGAYSAPNPGYPPPGYPPPGYPPPGYPPSGYPPPYPGYSGYQPPPEGWQRRRELRYREGDPIPPGYELQERPRRGLIISGSIIVAVPYFLGLLAASASDFSNQGGWLVVPVVGPFAALATRHGCNSDYESDMDCRFVRTSLIFDALVQTTGATLFILGLTSPVKRLVPLEGLHIAPTRIGSGYGIVSRAEF